ncbi:hypothetical protein NMY22_g6634 [Coprinellus aureogranulatus]|nr:hypothetical protein NMY22_g6634 [Coprinellus aureogranulatus]
MEAIMITEMRISDLSQERAAESYVLFVHRKKLIEQLPKDWEANLKVPESGPSTSGAQAEVSTANTGETEAHGETGQNGHTVESDSNNAQWEEEPRAINSNVAPTIPWAKWGPHHTRWLDSRTFSSVYITSTAGQRFVSIDKTARRNPSHIRVIDFNQYHVRKALTGELYPSVDKLVGVDRPGYDDEDEPWARKEPFADQSVESNLPYIEMTTNNTYNFNSVLLDEQRILGIRNVGGEDWNPTREVELIHFG